MLSQAPLYAYVPVHDLERAAAFYRDKLGLGPGEAANGGITFRFADGTAFFMYPTPNAGTNRASCAFWKVDDVRAVVAWLKGRGVVFEEYDMPEMKTVDSIFVGGGAAAAWFKDTEGNILAVISDAPA